MMRIQLFQVDAFTDQLFGGNSAAVCALNEWLPKDLLQKIASENFLPETAFFVPTTQEGHYDLKWFTPEIEMDLCGHATLASAHVLFYHLKVKTDQLVFSSNSGLITVTKKDDLLTLDFPSRMPIPTNLPDIILEGIGSKPIETLKSRDFVLVYENEQIIKDIKPNVALLNQINLDPGGIIVTAKGDEVDFVSRFFTPQASIFEDPVTGSAHCSLIPYWSQKLQKKQMTALQLSDRKGKLFCTNLKERVAISGTCVTYLEGWITIPDNRA